MTGCLTYAGLGLMAMVVVVKIINKFTKRSQTVFPRDNVVLHQLGRGPYAPSVSPFPLKLETYLRMANIPYVNDHHGGMSSKGKTPWMTYNGEDVADSQLCIQVLNKKLNIDLSQHLDPRQRAVATSFQRLVDEHLYWTMCAHTFGGDFGRLLKMLPYGYLKKQLVCRILRSKVMSQLWGQGIGRHTKGEIYQIGTEDIQALSDQIGANPYLMGAEPCEQDCAVFAMVSQIIWHMDDSPYYEIINERFPNLRDYCLRMKERFWPDWEECTTNGNTKEASN